MPHLNNKQTKNTNPIIRRQDYHLTQPCPSEEKQTNKQNSAQISSSTKLTQTTGSTLRGQKPKGRKNTTLKPGKRRPHYFKIKKKIMRRQRNTTQMKEQIRSIEVQINDEETGKLPEKEFRIIIIKMIKNLENKMEKMQESINKDLEELNNKHTETNNTITEIKISLEGINSRISEAEERISKLEDKMVEITSEEQNKVKRTKRTKDSLRDL